MSQVVLDSIGGRYYVIIPIQRDHNNKLRKWGRYKTLTMEEDDFILALRKAFPAWPSPDYLCRMTHKNVKKVLERVRFCDPQHPLPSCGPIFLCDGSEEVIHAEGVDVLIPIPTFVLGVVEYLSSHPTVGLGGMDFSFQEEFKREWHGVLEKLSQDITKQQGALRY